MTVCNGPRLIQFTFTGVGATGGATTVSVPGVEFGDYILWAEWGGNYDDSGNVFPKVINLTADQLYQTQQNLSSTTVTILVARGC